VGYQRPARRLTDDKVIYLGDIVPGLFPGAVFPTNPFTGAPCNIAAPGFSQGDLGYAIAAGIYTIEGYGETATVLTLSNG
jgi:hypothetical protein